MKDIENHWVAMGVPEIEDAPELDYERALLEAKEKVLDECDALDVFLEASILELQARCIQEAVAKEVDGVNLDLLQRAFDKMFMVNDAEFAVWIDLLIRENLPDYCLTMTAFDIQRAIYSVVEAECERIARGKL